MVQGCYTWQEVRQFWLQRLGAVETSSHPACHHPKREMRSLRWHCHPLPVRHSQNSFLLNSSEDIVHALGLPALRIFVCVPQRIRMAGHFWARWQPLYRSDFPKRAAWSKSMQPAKNRMYFKGFLRKTLFPVIYVWLFFPSFLGHVCKIRYTTKDTDS